MCHSSVISFFIENVSIGEFRGKRILEVGSKYVNGSVRPFIERFCHPKEYIGIDIEKGKFVDLILPAEKILDHFGQESFDAIISTETLEHVKDWRSVINSMKMAVKKNGVIYITTRSFGFPYHSYPYDFWRYEISDIKKIFSDFEILKLIKDKEAPGVLLKAKKPRKYLPADLGNLTLYSMILGKRTRNIPNFNEMPLNRKVSNIILPTLARKIWSTYQKRI